MSFRRSGEREGRNSRRAVFDTVSFWKERERGLWN